LRPWTKKRIELAFNLKEMSFIDFYKGFQGKKEFALFAWNDPMPFIRSTCSHLVNAWKQHWK